MGLGKRIKRLIVKNSTYSAAAINCNYRINWTIPSHILFAMLLLMSFGRNRDFENIYVLFRFSLDFRIQFVWVCYIIHR